MDALINKLIKQKTMKSISILKMQQTNGGATPSGTECFFTGLGLVFAYTTPIAWFALPSLGRRAKECWDS
jgi:hypothetical protein